MQLSYAAVAVAALGLQCALAQPAHQRHHHKHKRARPDAVQARDVDFNNPDLYKDVDWDKVFNVPKDQGDNTTGVKDGSQSEVKGDGKPEPTQETSPAATPNTQPSATQETQPKATPDNTANDTPQVSNSGKKFGGISTPVDDGDKDHYIGNVGIPYGSNMFLIDESERDNYKYTLTFTNPHDEETTYIVWNKSGRDGQPQSGMALPPNLKFAVSPKKAQVIALDENSQISFSRDCERNVKSGLADCTWGEADFGDRRNGGWSGYDCSSIPNTRGNVEYCKISCEGAKTSSNSYNSFTNVWQTNAGGSKAPGPVAIYAEL